MTIHRGHAFGAHKLWAPGLDAPLRQGFGERGEVRLWKGLGGDGPDGAKVAAGWGSDTRALADRCRSRCCHEGIVEVLIFPPESLVAFEHLSDVRWAGCRGLLDGLRVVEVSRVLRQEEHIFMRLRRAVRDALGHRIRLRPDDVAAEIPSVGLEGEGDTPRHSDEIFRFEARDCRWNRADRIVSI